MRTLGVTLLVAGAGYGKSTWVDAAAPAGAETRAADRTSPEELAALHAEPAGEVVLEDLHIVPAPERIDLLRALAPDRGCSSVTITSRVPLSVKERDALKGPIFERGPADLALSPAEVAVVLAEEYSVGDPELPSLVHHATAGWPMLVHLFADTLARRPDLGSGHRPRDPVGFAAAVAAADTGIPSWWEAVVLADLSDEQAELLAVFADLDVLTSDLVAETWQSDADSWVSTTYADACRVGLVTPHPRWQLLGRPGRRVVPALAAHLSASGSRSDRPRTIRAARWYRSHDHPMAALQCSLRLGDIDAAEALLEEAGDRMVAQGDAPDLVALLDPGFPGARFEVTDDRRALLARSLLLTGRADEASRVLRPLVSAVGTGRWDPALAVSAASVGYARGDMQEMADVLDRVSVDELPSLGVGMQWRLLRVVADSHRGDPEAVRGLAASMVDLAEESGDSADLCLAHQAMARVCPGHQRPTHLDRAAAYARSAGDATSMAPILCNQGFALLGSTDYRAAEAVSREAVRTSELVRPIGALVVALHNLAEALCRLGEFDEARWHLRRATAVAGTLGEGRVAFGMSGLGDLHRALGQRERARQAYEQAVGLARRADERQVLVPALAGLARVVAPENPADARQLVDEALDLAPPGFEAYALIGLAWVELAAGHADRASIRAEEAVAAARADQALDLLADALEARAVAEADPTRARESLLEALDIWREAGADPDACRVEVRLARLADADRTRVDRGRAAAQRLQRLGVARIGDRVVGDDPVGKDVRVLVLGGFDVVVAGRQVGLRAWKSRQARTLVKLLAARRGRPVSRGRLCEELWPDDDPVKTSHRLSVLLTTVRSVLDPERAWPPDHYVATDSRGVWLDLRRLSIDADDLIRDADHAAALLADGRAVEAAELLDSVDRRFRGEAFEDETYEAWSAALREESRTAWLRSLRHLATLATREGRHNDAAAMLARLLRTDPYDEKVHRGLVRTLVRSGRHGEARRAFRQWTEAMAAVDAPGPDPVELTPPAERTP